MTPWPGIRRGTDWTVPMVPGLVRRDRGAGEVVGRDLVGADLADQVLVRRQKPRKSRVSASLMHGTSRVRDAVGLLDVDGEAEADVGVADRPPGLPSRLDEGASS